MRSRVDLARLARDLVWVCLVLAVAAYGAAVVRNVTDALIAMSSRQPAMVVAE